MLKIIDGDLFYTNAKYLAHQTNCVTNKSAHLAKAVFTKYPYADIYKNRKEHSKPGTIQIRGNGEDQRYVINILGQYYPGKPKYPNSKKDGFEARTNYFFNSLIEVAKIEDLESIAFPYGIGCGAAGGNWGGYFDILMKFSDFVDAHVLIYRLNND